jgi:hypothetical protein
LVGDNLEMPLPCVQSYIQSEKDAFWQNEAKKINDIKGNGFDVRGHVRSDWPASRSSTKTAAARACDCAIVKSRNSGPNKVTRRNFQWALRELT